MSAPVAAPLRGVKVVSLAVNLPGPLAVAELVRLGATATKVEPPMGDPLAAVAPSWYDELVAGLDVVTVDLKSADGTQKLAALLEDCDILVTAHRPSALARLRLDAMMQNRDRLVHLEIVGGDGDLAEVPGHDLTYQAAHGTVLPPQMPCVPVADILGAERAVTAALGALLSRAQTGEGGRARVSLDAAAHAAAGAVRHGLTGPGDPLGGALPQYGLHRTSDGHIAAGALEPHFAERFRHHVGESPEEIADAFAQHPTAYWEALGIEHDIPLVGVLPARRTDR
ncbi:CoA transferase [Nocardioides currus]|uniref:CoA transferase n=1 Tax=Nocardioides currus TaxID=2133958 RepID=UPI001A9C4BED|nr:CoA transferase [Nocardioides currus]